MIPYEEALQRLLAAVSPLDVEETTVRKAGGRILAEEIVSPAALPPFANSAMDGFALRERSSGEAGASRSAIPAGTRVPVRGVLAAGDDPDGGSASGAAGSLDAVEIMTGAPIPAGCLTVVPVEKVTAEEEGGRRWIRLDEPVEPGANIRKAGRDLRAGDPVLGPGRRIGPGEMAALAGLGIPRIPVFRRPRVAVFCTGAELVEDPEAKLGPGMIRNSNGPFLGQALRELGAAVITNRTLGDSPDRFLRHLQEVRDEGVDLVLTTGAVSRGRWDFIPDAMEGAGARILFHGTAIRPGKPLLGATLPSGGLLVGLPGNPLSVAAGFRFFVQPVLRAMHGQGRERPRRFPLAEAVRKRPHLRYFVVAALEADADGGCRVRVVERQRSYRLTPMLEADAWAVLPEGVSELPAGALVDVHPLGADPVWDDRVRRGSHGKGGDR